MPHQHMKSGPIADCIRECLNCYTTCQQTALAHCLELGGKHVQPRHFRLMLDCAEICRGTAALMINGSPYHANLCALCAEICRACADSCRELGDMDDCVQACERCAAACEAMARDTFSASGGRAHAGHSR